MFPVAAARYTMIHSMEEEGTRKRSFWGQARDMQRDALMTAIRTAKARRTVGRY